jgi:hypothetical protein
LLAAAKHPAEDLIRLAAISAPASRDLLDPQLLVVALWVMIETTVSRLHRPRWSKSDERKD